MLAAAEELHSMKELLVYSKLTVLVKPVCGMR